MDIQYKTEQEKKYILY